MYKDEQKALLITDDQQFRNRLIEYFFDRYNLHTVPANDIMEAIHSLGGDNDPDSSFELIILDDKSMELETAAQTIKTIKSMFHNVNVLYLSTLLETIKPYSDFEMDYADTYEEDSEDSEEEYEEIEDEDLITNQIADYIDKHILLNMPLSKADNLEDTYASICESVHSVYGVDFCACVILRLDENPVSNAVVVSHYPNRFDHPFLFTLKGTGYLEEMLAYLKPIHIPYLEEDIAFATELEQKFSHAYGSVLLLPMQFDGSRIGFIGLFHQKSGVYYNLPDLDLLQRFADVATVAIITHFYKEHTDIDMNRIEEEMKQQKRSDSLY